MPADRRKLTGRHPLARLLEILLVSTGALLFNSALVTAVLQVYVACLLTLAGRWRMAAAYVLLVAGFTLLLPGMKNLDASSFWMFLFGIAFTSLKILPIMAMTVYALATVNIGDLMKALERLRLPREFTLPLGVTLRFIPSMAEEYRAIRSALRFRGVWGPVQPCYAMAPLLIRSLKIGDELAAAAITRGIEARVGKTSFREVRWAPGDTVYAATLCCGFLLLLIVDNYYYLCRLFR